MNEEVLEKIYLTIEALILKKDTNSTDIATLLIYSLLDTWRLVEHHAIRHPWKAVRLDLFFPLIKANRENKITQDFVDHFCKDLQHTWEDHKDAEPSILSDYIIQDILIKISGDNL
jgi:hypothetical protein